MFSKVATVSPAAESGTAATAEAAGVESTFPTDAADPISVTGANSARAPIEIGLPFADTASPARVESNGAVTYDNNNGTTSIAVAKTDGSVQIATVITTSSSPTRFEYQYSVPAGGSLTLDKSGAAFILGSDGLPLGYVQAPWAFDANGVSVPTHCEVVSSTLVQVVEHDGATYPVVADPQTLFFWWGQAIKFTRAETAAIGGAADTGRAVSIFCSYIPLVNGRVVCLLATFIDLVGQHRVVLSSRGPISTGE